MNLTGPIRRLASKALALRVWLSLALVFQHALPAALGALFLLSYSANDAQSAAGVPHLVNFQGRLTNTSNNPQNGSFTLKFAIYNAASAGTRLWPTSVVTENHTVLIVNGVFSVILGDGGTNAADAIPSAVFGQDQAYVEVIVNNGADETMSPRQKLLASPYALNSERLDGYAGEYYVSTAAVTQTILGDKTYSGTISVPAPTLAGHAATKGYVDGFVSGVSVDITASTQTKVGGLAVAGYFGAGTSSPETQLHVYRAQGTRGPLMIVSTGTTKLFEVNGTSVLVNVPLRFSDGSAQTVAGISALSVDTLTNKTWNGNTITVPYGGTGATTLTGILKGNGAGAFTAVTAPSGVLVGDSDTQTLTDKTLGSGTVYNGNTITVPYGGTGATTLTGILKGNGAGAFTAVAAPTGALVGDTDTQTLTNKTLGSGTVIANISGPIVIISTTAKEGSATTAGTQQVVGSTQTQTLTNKTLGAGTVIGNVSAGSIVGISTAAKEGSATTAGTQQVVGSTQTQTLTNKTLGAGTVLGNIPADLIVGISTAAKEGNATTAGTQEVVGSTQTQTLTNKTLGAGTVIGNISAGSIIGISTAAKEGNATTAGTQQVVGSTQTQTLTFKTWNGNAITVPYGGSGVTTLTGILKGNGASNFSAVTAPSGALVGDTDTQTLTNKTLGSGTVYNGGTIAVGYGGTGATTLTGILKGNGAGAFTAVTAPTGALVGDTDTQTLTNKTLGAGTVIGNLSAGSIVGISTAAKEGNVTTAGTQQVVGSTQTQTMTNKTLGSGTSYNGGTIAVGYGGTGATTLTGILKGNGASNFSAVTAPSGALVGDTDTQTLTNKTVGSTGLTFSGATTDITTGSNEDFTIMPNGAGKVGIGTLTPGANFYVVGTSSVTGKFVSLNTTNQVYAVYAP